jgi:DNA-directed RNA polymerase specialized sigma24 family protein/CheY-like chemotaxis protein
MSLGQDLAPHLPFLRRYARALVGSQSLGDRLVRATLEQIVADPDSFPRDVDLRLALYKTFENTAADLSAEKDPIDDEDRLRPEFAAQVLDAVEARDYDTVRQLVEPLHPADVADLVELAAADEREGLVKALAGMVSPDVLAEMNDYVREGLLDNIEQEGSPNSQEGISSSRWNRLAEKDRKALLLSGLEGFDPEDVAYLLDISTADAELLIANATSELEQQTRSKILIIEPSEATANDLRNIVGELGHTVTTIARTRSEAILAARIERPDLIISEVELADGETGIETIKEIQANVDVPVIFITRKPELLLVRNRPEPAFLITKPYQRSTVRSAIAQAIFFDAPLSSRLPHEEERRISTAVSSDEIRPVLRAKPAPVDAVVIQGQLRLAEGEPPASALPKRPLEALQVDFREDVDRLLQLATNIGPAFSARLRRLRSLLHEPLSEASALRIANQTEALAEFRTAAEEALNASDAADVIATIAALRNLVRQFAIWKAFEREAAEAAPLPPEVEDALRQVSQTIERQSDELVAPELKEALSEVRETSEESGAPPAALAFVRGVSNVAKAIARYALDRVKGAGAEFNKAIDKEVGGALASTVSNLFLALSTPLIALALHLPAEFSWVGPVLAILRQALNKR